MRNPLPVLLRLPASLLILTTKLYQRTLSPDHGPFKALYPYGYCRHAPTCSQYAIQTLQTRSLPVALGLIVKRLLSCNPFAKPSDARLLQVISRG
ncbi:MAG TPA: membrane protein insertion efficiency factor YidD [Candidatus Peribacteria bacterium]|nr:membrane protein insertion efficiency factor YidD [Candidatus Peribacteria bacterium]